MPPASNHRGSGFARLLVEPPVPPPSAAPGVVLEMIRPKEVVLRAQGYRFTEKS